MILILMMVMVLERVYLNLDVFDESEVDWFDYYSLDDLMCYLIDDLNDLVLFLMVVVDML